MNEQHLFTLFCKNLSKYVSGGSDCYVEFSDRDLWQRLTKVLRLRAGEKMLLFDEHVNAATVVQEKTFTKKELLALYIESVNSNQAIKPNITLMPCLLKKDAFEDIIYAAAQMGVNKIIPILSDKVQRPWGEKKERERLFNIMVAACEQSKSFFLPEICEPVKIQDIAKQGNSLLLKPGASPVGDGSTSSLPSLDSSFGGQAPRARQLDGARPEPVEGCEFQKRSNAKPSLKIYFDPSGACFVDLLKKIKESNDQKNDYLDIILFFGPEGGLTGQEEKLLSDLGFETYALTPTILRAREAVIVGLGGVRSAR
ncbi:MAG: RsmE family RNA methyltransferase [bacterium]